MKKIMIAAAVAATAALGSCTGKSESSREQISAGREHAREMLEATRNTEARPAETATEAPRQEKATASDAKAPEAEATDSTAAR